MSTSTIHIVVMEQDLQHKRLDSFLNEKIPHLSRSAIKKLFQEKKIISGDSNLKLELKKMPAIGTEIFVSIEDRQETLSAENIALRILYEDEYLLAIDKPAGLVVHPGAGNTAGTLVNALLHHHPDIATVGDPERPGIVHRLDKGTTGVMLAAKTQECYQELTKMFANHHFERQYLALVMGSRLESKGSITTQIARHPKNRLKMTSHIQEGKEAITHFEILEFLGPSALVSFTLETGRTHQIRVHSSEGLHAPLLNDSLYGNIKEQYKKLDGKLRSHLSHYEHPLLHAERISFVHPMLKKKLDLKAELPKFFELTLHLLRDIYGS
jgi:23S rRNA pseudouridine1911/1915/1917 synthase